MTLLRVYEPHECGKDGYPFVWHDGLTYCLTEAGELRWAVKDPPIERARPLPFFGDNDSINKGGVKDLVRAEAGDRCVRCGHPYKVGAGGYVDAPSDTAAAEVYPQIEGGEHLDWGSLSDPGQVAPQDRFPPGERPVNWSPCDEHCRHLGPLRWRASDRSWLGAHEDCTPQDFFQADPDGVVEVQAAWRILTVHHLNGRKHDLRWWNLTSLCQRCHLSIQKKVQMERVFPFEHTEWFKPYAAGWYAYAYLGENLTREQTMARLDDLLALERMA